MLQSKHKNVKDVFTT